MTTRVKICGLSTPSMVASACEAGADFVGFVLAQGSPRTVAAADAAALAASVPGGVQTVVVLKRATAEVCAAIFDTFEPDWLQADATSLEGIDLPARTRLMPVFRDGENLPAAAPTPLLYEAAVSGQGTLANWDVAGGLAGRTSLMLAGGLDPSNVAGAVRRVRPWAVDVSSGVESAPGQKDPVRIRAFVEAVRQEETA